MQTEYVDVRGKWGIVLCYDLDLDDDIDIMNYMMSLGSDEEGAYKAVNVLFGQENAGLCVTNMALRMSLIFIGDADSAEQWWDTLSHELYHAQQAIIEYYNVPPDTEKAAWTMGYLMRKSVELVAPPCR
jgi:hypothetical protein